MWQIPGHPSKDASQGKIFLFGFFNSFSNKNRSFKMSAKWPNNWPNMNSFGQHFFKSNLNRVI